MALVVVALHRKNEKKKKEKRFLQAPASKLPDELFKDTMSPEAARLLK